MLGIQNSLPVTNSVKFGQNESRSSGYSPDIEDYVPDEFSREAIQAERDKKLADIDNAKAGFDDLANSLEKNPDKLSKKASKFIRVASAVIGLAGTFVMAKYGSKVMINTFKEFGKSGVGKSVVDGARGAAKPVQSVLASIKKAAAPLVKSFEGSKLGKVVAEFAQKPRVKSVLDTVAGYKEASKTLLKSINGEKVQSVVENTMAASTTASVLIDDLAGRNDDKSNLDLALGASGGDK